MKFLRGLKGHLIVCLILVLPLIAKADTQSGLIGSIKVTDDQVAFTLKAVSGQICLQADERYIFELTTAVKKYWSAMILAASHSNKRIAVRFDQCTVRGDKKVMYIFQDFI
jgi:hypothetical protein